MSQETQEWLENNVRYNANHRMAWWDDGSDRLAGVARFNGPVPIESVRELFAWEPIAGSLDTTVTINGIPVTISDPDRQVIVRPDTQEVMGVFKSGYKIHSYNEWLTTTLANLVHSSTSEMDIASAGLLRRGAVGWLTIEAPDVREHDGIKFRPFVTSATSLDGSLATTFNRGASMPICDNTLSAALNDQDAARIKFKHTRNSPAKLGEVRSALELLDVTAEAFTDQLDALTSTEISESQWAQLVDLAAP